MLKAILLSTVILAGCVQSPKPNYYKPAASAAEYENLYKSCVREQVKLLDDGISPANVVGLSVANSCNQEYIAFAMEEVSEDNQAVQRAFYSEITRNRNLAAEMPTKYVLAQRASKSRSGR